jgi:CubicO group peptidase (beta-lactamase class C family)
MNERGPDFDIRQQLETSSRPGDERLDHLERRARDAWLTLGADGEAPADEDRVDEGFVQRVLDALEASQPRLVLLDTPAPAAAVPWWRQRRPAWMAAAVAALVAGFVGVSTPSGSDERDDVAVLADIVDTDSAPDPTPQADDAPLAPSLPDGFDRDVEAYISDYGRNYGPAFRFHGVILVARSGQLAYRRAFGMADPETGDPNTPDTRFRLGLLTEPLTATAILQLAEDERIDIDDPLSRYLPQYPRGEQITIRDLLTHRSGIPNYTDDPSFHSWKSQAHRTDQMLERFAHWPLEFEPGSDVLPSNSNYFLLGAVIERITGAPYADYVQRNIFAPAGMRNSRFGDDFSDGHQARGNVWNDDEQLDPPRPLDMSTFGAAGGLVSTPNDMVAFDHALHDGTLLSAESRRQMIDADEDGYGFGWVVSHAYGQELLSFPGAIDGYSGALLHFVEHDTTVLVLANTEVVPGNVVAQDVALILYGDTPPRRNEPVEIKIAPGTYYKYVGAWGLAGENREQYAKLILPERVDMLREVYVQEQDDRLYFDVPGHARTWMHPMGHERFFFKDHSGNQVSFELGDDRRAAKLFVHNGGRTLELSRLPSPAAPVAP